MTTPPAWATCATCHGAFAYDAGFYRERVLLPPRRCRACREQRASRVIRVLATVTVREPAFIFATGDDNGRYFIAPHCVAADVGELHVGDRVALDVDPEAVVLPNRRPRALRVRRP